jgi:heme/copper-type cytochrome/quinol oxidase subunit 2
MKSGSQANTFVTVLAWLLICFTAFGVLMSLLQNVMIGSVFPAMNAQAPRAGQISPEFMVFFRTLAAFVLIVQGFLLFAAWSFLRRRNWARRAFVVVFVLSAAWAGFTALASLGMGVLMPHTPRPGSEMPPAFAGVFRIMGLLMAIVSAAFAVLFAWLVKRLRTPEVRAEFHSERLQV